MQETPFSLEQFELLFKEHFKQLALLAYKDAEDKDVARNIVQEFYVKFWETQHVIHLKQPFEVYVAHAVNGRHTGCSMQEQLYLRLSQAIAFMPEQRRRVFLLSAADNVNYAGIARQLHISVNTVKFHLKAAYVFLRNECFRREEAPVIQEYFLIREAAKGWQELADTNLDEEWNKLAARITTKQKDNTFWCRATAIAVITIALAGTICFLLHRLAH